jgi:hypothetical protein
MWRVSMGPTASGTASQFTSQEVGTNSKSELILVPASGHFPPSGSSQTGVHFNAKEKFSICYTGIICIRAQSWALGPISAQSVAS